MKFKHQAKALKEIRLEMGLTQKELGDILGVHTQAVSNAEHGVRGIAPERLSILTPMDKHHMFKAITADFKLRLTLALK